jgi:hypothetical protein
VNRFFQLLIAMAAFAGGLWFFYSGYGREVSLAGKTETGLTYLKTGLDGKTRVMTHHWRYGAGLILILGSTWWMVKGGALKPGKRRR